MSRPRAGTFARIESERQALVRAEEAFLKAHAWTRVLVGGDWLWCRSHVPPGQVIMRRVDAVYFQNSNYGKEE